jgi:hypothetical protein
MYQRTRHSAVAAISLCVISLPALGIEDIPQSPGWRGFVVFGGGYTDLDSNLVAGNKIIDIGQDRISSVNVSPQSDDAWHPIVSGEAAYTFASGWQAFVGTSLVDAVTLDGVAQLGARKEVDGIGILQGGLLFSGIPTEVWEDPYAEGVSRKDTDRDSSGVRFQWDRMFGTAFEFTFSYRDIDIDTERSGQGVNSVPCNAACQSLLRRDGDEYSVSLSYLFKAGERHLIRPLVAFASNDRDGDAISGDAYRLQLTYSYLGDGFTVVSNAAFGGRDYDTANPIYGIKTDSDRLAVDATLFYRLPSPSGRWQAVGNILWGEDDSDVDFHSTEVFQFTLGALYRFGGESR